MARIKKGPQKWIARPKRRIFHFIKRERGARTLLQSSIERRRRCIVAFETVVDQEMYEGKQRRFSAGRLMATQEQPRRVPVKIKNDVRKQNPKCDDHHLRESQNDSTPVE